MHIYFSGIGGTGIGPLAVIAKQAGYQVSGSDMQRSQYTNYIANQGIKFHIDQTEEKIASEHTKNPIDWIVFSSAVLIDNPKHPELLFALNNGIKVSKRDECLNMILDQKQLKLVAVAGTHGKTTTTALIVWLFKQFGVPVSYSVGAKISFGDMGVYNPKSKYFVYECDEFDKNFLSFKPYVSAITTVDWDHHDIYPTIESYYSAFKKFINQSETAFLYKRDAQYLNLGGSNKVKTIDDSNDLINQIKLAGLHNRQNSCIAIKAIASLLDKTEYELVKATNGFPGTTRRFERIVENVYSDYAHTPEEIAATLQMAKELSDNIVVVYEPLTDRRQHYIKEQYKDVFNGVKKVYWLPSYLAREDPELNLLTPEDLVEYLDKSITVEVANKNSKLKNAIINHSKNGDVVLCLAGGGGSSLDEWVRKHF